MRRKRTRRTDPAATALVVVTDGLDPSVAGATDGVAETVPR